MRLSIILIVLGPLFLSCSSKQEFYPRNYQIVRSTIISDNISPFGKIKSLAVDENQFAIITESPAALILYDENGRQKKVVKSGSNRNEFINPSIVRIVDKKVYVWCSSLLQMFVFTSEGEFLDKFKGFESAIRDFSIGSNSIALYSTGHLNNFITIYSMSERHVEQIIGEKTQNQILMDLSECAGGIITSENAVLFCSSSELSLIEYNLLSDRYNALVINDKDFNSARIEGGAMDLISTDRKKSVDLFLSSAMVKAILPTQDGFLIQAEVGSIKNDGQSLSTKSRFEKYYSVSKSLKYLGSAIFELDRQFVTCLTASYKDHVYRIRGVEKDNEVEYSLVEIDKKSLFP